MFKAKLNISAYLNQITDVSVNTDTDDMCDCPW